MRIASEAIAPTTGISFDESLIIISSNGGEDSTGTTIHPFDDDGCVPQRFEETYSTYTPATDPPPYEGGVFVIDCDELADSGAVMPLSDSVWIGALNQPNQTRHPDQQVQPNSQTGQWRQVSQTRLDIQINGFSRSAKQVSGDRSTEPDSATEAGGSEPPLTLIIYYSSKVRSPLFSSHTQI
ncbi:hypothetical protein U1Q18_013702 [Sarracenia purpurea var. burkii]